MSGESNRYRTDEGGGDWYVQAFVLMAGGFGRDLASVVETSLRSEGLVRRSDEPVEVNQGPSLFVSITVDASQATSFAEAITIARGAIRRALDVGGIAGSDVTISFCEPGATR